MFIAVLSVRVKIQNQPECSLTDGWICILKCYVAIKSEILRFMITWMDLKDITLSEISQRKANTVQSLKSELYGRRGKPSS